VDCVPPVDSASWGLDRIAEVQMQLDGFYTYPATAGGGVVAYIIDTGIFVEHEDFVGRAKFGWKAESLWSDTDKNGHGTHVASTTMGIKYGVARRATSIAVKVLGDNGSGSNAGVIGGVDWTIAQYLSNKQRSVINMSLGGGFSAALNNAVNQAVTEGIVVAVAAGNSNADACFSSPASAEKVISVGSTQDGLNNKDVRSSFSNFGTCVDIFAPGSAITAAWCTGVKAVNTISGTSMASPHVAGVGALLLAENPDLSAEDIQEKLISWGTKDLITMNCGSAACNESPNIMLWNGCTHD